MYNPEKLLFWRFVFLDEDWQPEETSCSSFYLDGFDRFDVPVAWWTDRALVD